MNFNQASISANMRIDISAAIAPNLMTFATKNGMTRFHYRRCGKSMFSIRHPSSIYKDGQVSKVFDLLICLGCTKSGKPVNKGKGSLLTFPWCSPCSNGDLS